MNAKKMLGLALSGAMAFSMMAPAMAATVSDLAEGAELEVTGTTQVPKIEIEVPSNAAIILNPYGITAELPTEFGSLTATDQIISPAYSIENKSGIPIKMGYKVTGTVSGVELVTAAPDDTKKQVKLDFAIEAAAAAGDPTATAAAVDPTAGIDVKTTDTGAIELDAAAANADVFANFKFTGDVSKNPTTAWTTDDTVGATIAFTFAPNAPTA